MKKKRTVILLCALIAAAVAVALFARSKAYQPASFAAEGEFWAAAVENGGELILSLDREDTGEKWAIASSPECFSSDYSSDTENGTEFHIVALDEGKGEMVFHSVKEDGSIEKHILTLSISRHQKTYLQIDSVAFDK